ncbi:MULTISPECIES: Ulp1 family isopeptidase [Mesorhizobium]|uniref:Ubiquitin-like protease family profile domain-containing protein n=1 Tax=Mesorhizobium neociceri TaxID=1307853 RepID=A0A838BCW4_9HYPH|nr:MULTISPECIES: Ulp1 family isopeptidase [Mesorhizobium]MBA1143907.1 hypothetical protein [Mesorhizobium neociceri]
MDNVHFNYTGDYTGDYTTVFNNSYPGMVRRQQQESGNIPADDAGSVQQLSELHLNSSEASSQDAPFVQAHGDIQRTDLGGSMRMPPKSDLRDGQFSSTRHSIEVGGSAARVLQSDLRDSLSRSTRSTAPWDPQPVGRTKDSKSRGLWSRVKSGVGRAFGESRREKSSGGSAHDVVYSELRMDFAKRGHSDADLYSDDKSLLENLAAAVRGYEILPDGSIGRGDGRVPEHTLTHTVGVLRRFARWLRAEDRTPIASRLYADEEEFAKDIKAYKDVAAGDDGRRVLKALSHLRKLAPGGQELQSVGPGPRLMGRQTAVPYPEDGHVIDGIYNERVSKGDKKPSAHSLASGQRKFSDWLRSEKRGSIVSRLNGTEQQQASLQADYGDFITAMGQRYGVAFDRFRTYIGAQPKLTRHQPYPDDAEIIRGFLTEQVSNGANIKTAESTATRQRRFSEWLQAEKRDSIMSCLNGTEQQQASLAANYQDFREAVGPTGMSLKRMVGALAQYVQENRPLESPPEQARQRPTRGRPSSSSHQEFPTNSNARTAALGPTASSNVPVGSVLGYTEWLSDAHIQRDYELLQEELQQIDPGFAASIRLVDPMVSHLLGLPGTDQRTVQRHLQSIIDQNNARANFLFLPINNGTHWSLLLVDSSNSERPAVAYHYDSLQRRRYNDAAATALARRIGAMLTPARMAEQQNDYDCGVFVVDGTRALVQRLREGGWPAREPLHLDNIVVSREQLRLRLSPAPRREGGEPDAAADSFNTQHWQQFSPIVQVPELGVEQSSWQADLGASIFGATPPVQAAPPELGQFAPPDWQHGNQWAPTDLMRGMYWHNVLPSQDQPKTNFMIGGMLYTAVLHGTQDLIQVYPS